MNDVDLLIGEKNNAVAVLCHEFILNTGKLGTSAFYYFVEGKDAPYYQFRIKQLCSLELIPINCRGKKNVLKVYSHVNLPMYSKYKKAFFVDKDFDDSVHISNDVYVTPCYSIENLYTSEDTLSNILKCEFGILPSDESYSKIIELFSKEKNEFHNAISELNIWYACIKSQIREAKVCLKDLKLCKLVNLQIGKIVKNYDINDIRKNFSIDIDICPIEFARKSEELNANRSLLYRGKYEIEFFYQFLIFLIDDANSKNKRNYFKKKCNFQVNKSSIISNLSQYANTPSCLIAYLKRRVV